MDKKALKHLETHNTEIYWNLKWLTALNLSSQPPGFDCGVQNLEMFSLQRNDSGEKVCFNMWQNINMCYKISALYGFYWILLNFIWFYICFIFFESRFFHPCLFSVIGWLAWRQERTSPRKFKTFRHLRYPTKVSTWFIGERHNEQNLSKHIKTLHITCIHMYPYVNICHYLNG